MRIGSMFPEKKFLAPFLEEDLVFFVKNTTAMHNGCGSYFQTFALIMFVFFTEDIV